MKNFIGLLLLCFILFSCKEVQKEIAINGKIMNSENNYLMIYLPHGVKDTIKIDNEGNFTYSVPNPEEPITPSLGIDKSYIPLYLAKGMSLIIILDAQNLPGSIKFEGAGSNPNNYLALMSAKNKELNLEDYEIFKKDTATFLAWNDGVRETQFRLFTDFKKEDEANPFWKTQLAEIEFGWANRMEMYPSYYNYYTDSIFIFGLNYYDFQDFMDINNSNNLGSGEFQQFLSTFMAKKGGEAKMKFANDSVKPSYSLVVLRTAMEILKNDSVRNYFLTSYSKGIISYKPFSELTEELKFYRENCSDKKLLADFEKEYQSRLLLQKGQPAIDFTGETAAGEKVKLSDFKGKYVYVDVWATWCGPCNYEIPYLKKLEEDYASKNIVFLSYSIDDDRKAWEKFVPEKELKGVQIIGEKAWESKLCKDYKINGVPTFMLFDTEGKIFSCEMTRPSDEKTRKTFDGLPGI